MTKSTYDTLDDNFDIRGCHNHHDSRPSGCYLSFW